jgi:hypothetical protein
LFANYIFVTQADYSRAIAQTISPMMKLGQLLPPNTDYPVDLPTPARVANLIVCGSLALSMVKLLIHWRRKPVAWEVWMRVLLVHWSRAVSLSRWIT